MDIYSNLQGKFTVMKSVLLFFRQLKFCLMAKMCNYNFN